MRIIKVDAIDSTNLFVRKFYEGKEDFEPICVRAIEQTYGRGQRGSNWYSKAGENLTFSILYPQKQLNISRHFSLSAAIALAVISGLNKLNIPGLRVKWPNDIMSSNRKIGGILIENIVKSEGIVASVIGIGLNVNQQQFNDLPQASSLFNVTQRKFDIDEVLKLVVFEIENSIAALSRISLNELLGNYKVEMFRLNQVSVFMTPDGGRFNGIIRGVTKSGKLQLELENDEVREYGMKEIQLLY